MTEPGVMVLVGIAGYLLMGWVTAIAGWKMGAIDSPIYPVLSWPVVALVAIVGIAMVDAANALRR